MRKNVGRWVEIGLESVEYLVLQLLLASALFSFHRSWFYILLFPVNVALIGKYWRCLEEKIGRKWIQVLIFALCCAAELLICGAWGYIQMEWVQFFH